MANTAASLQLNHVHSNTHAGKCHTKKQIHKSCRPCCSTCECSQHASVDPRRRQTLGMLTASSPSTEAQGAQLDVATTAAAGFAARESVPSGGSKVSSNSSRTQWPQHCHIATTARLVGSCAQPPLQSTVNHKGRHGPDNTTRATSLHRGSCRFMAGAHASVAAKTLPGTLHTAWPMLPAMHGPWIGIPSRPLVWL